MITNDYSGARSTSRCAAVREPRDKTLQRCFEAKIEQHLSTYLQLSWHAHLVRIAAPRAGAGAQRAHGIEQAAIAKRHDVIVVVIVVGETCDDLVARAVESSSSTISSTFSKFIFFPLLHNDKKVI